MHATINLIMVTPYLSQRSCELTSLPPHCLNIRCSLELSSNQTILLGFHYDHRHVRISTYLESMGLLHMHQDLQLVAAKNSFQE